VSSIGDPNNGFTETGDYTSAGEGGKTKLHFDVMTGYFGFLPRLFEPLITPKARKKVEQNFQRMKELIEAEPRGTA